ncbi:hypothetical protein N1851_006857 [Merluccius polli]|uniref:Uncharacterized protein n=1 Tax=Merluccius polli TaxID=89951 RepID=A0AA47N530_MERPO|nr:hypothetical protein N1851_006857 [Merluccius polli]
MQCKFCKFASSSQEAILKHCRLRHNTGAHWPCIHTDCTSDIVSHRKATALRCLPVFVRDDTTKFFLRFETDPEERVLRGVTVGILTILEEDDPAVSPNVRHWAVVLEGSIVLHDLPDLSTAFAYLFGLLYAMNIDYPKEMKYTFEAIQSIFFLDSQNAIMLHNPPDLGTAFVYLFGLLYVMNIDYPKEMKYTYEAIQTIFFELGSVLKSPLPLK